MKERAKGIGRRELGNSGRKSDRRERKERGEGEEHGFIGLCEEFAVP